MKLKIVVFLILILIVFSLISLLVMNRVLVLPNAISIGISILAIIISIISSFKNEIFPYDLLVYSGSLHLLKTPAIFPSNGISINVMLPVTFFNRGYGECFINKIQLVVKPKNKGGEYTFIPQIEIDLQALIQQKVGLNASNILGSFVGFLLESKKGIKKNIVFIPLVGDKQPQFVLQADSYTFEIHVQVYGDSKFKKYYEIQQEVSKKNLDYLVNFSTILSFL